MANDVDGVSRAIAEGADPNAKSGLGYPMAAWAIVCKASLPVFTAVVDGGADMQQAMNTEGQPSVAELAVAFCRPDVLGFLERRKLLDLDKRYQHNLTLEEVPTLVLSSKTGQEMDRLFKSLRLARELASELGPLEGAFAPSMVTPRKAPTIL